MTTAKPCQHCGRSIERRVCDYCGTCADCNGFLERYVTPGVGMSVCSCEKGAPMA